MYKLIFVAIASLALASAEQLPLQIADASAVVTKDPVPYSTRAHWMRKANEALSLLSSPCPIQAFGTVIVNHTKTTEDGLGELVCIGINQINEVGNPTLHGN